VSHTFTHLLYHLIFSTKGRQPLIDPELQPRLFAYLGGIVRELNGQATAIGGMPDHVHLLVHVPPTIAISDALRVIKTNSSKWVHETGPERHHFAWQAGYGAFSMSRSHREAVADYIARQAEHHRRRSFQEEFLEFLKRHDLEYDERYIWD
jgi:REP-associated tyrosine transposase